MSTTIHFLRFANGVSGSAHEVPFATTDVIAKLAKKHGGLASKCVEAVYDENADLQTACCGTVFAGIRPVARFRVIDNPPRTEP